MKTFLQESLEKLLQESYRRVLAGVCGRILEGIFGGNLAGISAGVGAISNFSSWIPVRTPEGIFREINERIHGGMPGGEEESLGEFLQILNKT